MSESRLQRRVGAFVLICLLLAALLLLAFSKSTALFTPTYGLKMRIKNVGGLKERSAVFLAGIQVGYLKSAELAPDSRSVVLNLRIQKKYSIHKDASFSVEQIGVLGDQFVSIYPGENKEPLLQEGDEVAGRDSFNLQETARSVGDLIKELTFTLAEIREAVTNVKNGVLDRGTLSNITSTIANFRKMSEGTLTVVQDIGSLVRTNSGPLTYSVSNMAGFSERLEKVAGHLDETITTNRSSISGTLTNLAETTAALRNIANDLNAGRGLAGSLLKDEQLQLQAHLVASNLVVLSSNLNRYGLLYKPRTVRSGSSTSNQVYRGKSPF